MANQDNSGVLFKNDRKETDRHPDYTGSATVDGVDYFMDAWINESKKNPGQKYMGFKFKRKDKQSGPVRTTNGGAAPAGSPDAAPSAGPAPNDEKPVGIGSFLSTPSGYEDDIPF